MRALVGVQPHPLGLERAERRAGLVTGQPDPRIGALHRPAGALRQREREAAPLDGQLALGAAELQSREAVGQGAERAAHGGAARGAAPAGVAGG